MEVAEPFDEAKTGIVPWLTVRTELERLLLFNIRTFPSTNFCCRGSIKQEVTKNLNSQNCIRSTLVRIVKHRRADPKSTFPGSSRAIL